MKQFLYYCIMWCSSVIVRLKGSIYCSWYYMTSYKIFKLQLCIMFTGWVVFFSCCKVSQNHVDNKTGSLQMWQPVVLGWIILKPWESQAGKLSWKDLSGFNNTLVGFLKALSSTWFCAKDFLWVYNSLNCMVSSSHNLHRLCQPGCWEASHVCLVGHLSPDMVQKGWAFHYYPTEKVLFCSLPTDCETWYLCWSKICSGFLFRKGRSMSLSFFSFSVLK